MTQPLAYNRWAGNDFVVPGLPVRPTYAPALAPAQQNAPSPAADILQQLGFRLGPTEGRGIGEMQGAVTDASNKFDGSPNSASPGFGPGRQARSLGDFLGSAAMGVGMVTGPVGFATGMAGLAGPTSKAGYDWQDILPFSGLFDFNGGPVQGPPTAWDSTPSMVDLDTGYSYGDTSGRYDGGFADTTEPGLARGGTVTPRHLMGPNPRGPDDGFAALDVGEEVIPRRAAQRLRQQHGEGLFGMLREGQLPRKRK
jgi:hypothetical protein